jgi:sialidase-1
MHDPDMLHARIPVRGWCRLFLLPLLPALGVLLVYGQERWPVDGQARILGHSVIAEAPGRYSAWPSVVRTANEDILVLYAETEEHLGPDGRIMGVRSTDNGLSWLPSSVVYDSPIDDRESGITILRDGAIVAHLWSTFHTRAAYEALPDLSYEPSVLQRWSALVDSPGYRSYGSVQGAWKMISHDNGQSWSSPVRGIDAVHGGIQLRDGALLIASYRLDYPRMGIYSASTAEAGYECVCTLSGPPGDSVQFGEPHILQLLSGRVIMLIRATAVKYDDMSPLCVLWETYSDDNGKTWVPPFRTPLWGFPPHLLQLSDGRVLCTYGYRRPPFGQRVCLSRDGITWELRDEVTLRDDAPNGDLGYPASVELDSTRILTVYYQPNVPNGTHQQMHPPDPRRTKPAILGTVWRRPPLRSTR